MNEQPAGAEGDLDQVVGVELRELRGLQVGRDKESATGDFLGCIDHLLHVEAATIFLEDMLKDDIIGFLDILTLFFAFLDRAPYLVRLLQRHDLVVLVRFIEASWSEAFQDDDNLDTVALRQGH